MNDHKLAWCISYCREGDSEWIRLWWCNTRKKARELVKEFKKDDRKLGFKLRYRISKEEV